MAIPHSSPSGWRMVDNARDCRVACARLANSVEWPAAQGRAGKLWSLLGTLRKLCDPFLLEAQHLCDRV